MTAFCALTDRRLAVVLIAGLWFGAFDANAFDPLQLLPPVVPPGTPSETQPGCADALCERVKEQSKRGCVAASDVPYAETIILRRGLTPELPGNLKNDLGIAMMSADADFAAERLGGYLEEGSATARYLAAMHLAMVMTRAGVSLYQDKGPLALETMRTTASELPFPASDLLFFEALVALENGRQGEAREHLRAALRVEPRFFNAVVRLLQVEIERVQREERRSRRLCLNAFDDLFQAALSMMDIEVCIQQAAHLDLLLARGISDPSQSAPYQAVRVYLAILARRPGIAKSGIAAIEQASGSRCRLDIARRLESWLEGALDGGP